VRTIGGHGHADHYGWGMDTIPPGLPGAGNVVVTDYWNLKVTELEPDGDLVRDVIPATRPGGPPYDVAVNPLNGNLAVGNVDGGRTVDIYTRDGAFLRSCGGPSRWTYAAWLDYDGTGRLVVADSRGHRMFVISDVTCGVLFSFGSQGSGTTQFNSPRGVDVGPDGVLWVNDVNNRRISAWTLGASSATPLRRFSVTGADNRGLVLRPADGLLYLVNASNASIDVYSQTGTLVRRFGSRGTAPGQFIDGGRGITVDGEGGIWVGDMPNFRSQRFSATGTVLATGPPGAQPPPPDGYNQPGGATVLADGTLAVVDSFNWRVVLQEADGDPLSTFGTRLIFNYPRGIAADLAQGTVVVANTDAQNVVEHLGGQRLWTATGVKAWDVAVGPTGTVYAAEFELGRVRIIQPNGALGATFGTGQLSNPRGIAIDPLDGSVWVANQGTGRVVHFSASGALLGSFATPSQQLTGIALDATTVFVSDKAGNVIRLYSRAGALRATVGGGGSAPGRFQQPAGLDVRGDRLYVTETGNERVQELRITS
jgi:DNA-binding beta-propeller fold protein YncE